MKSKQSAIQQEIRQTRPFASKAQEATIALVRTVDVMMRHFESIVEPYGITGQQYNVLRILRGAQGKLPTMEIGERMIEQAPGVTRMLDRLEKKGLVRRERDGSDRRQVLCEITPAGLELLGKLDQPVLQADEEIMAPLSLADQEKLVELLDAIRSGWK